jgi:8-oxo-dGTP pyrophosphatase MutT (NUDIX family)
MALIPAAAVILVRERAGLVETLLLRRHKQSGFMADAFVFPGGKIDAGESDEQAALRELFEEAGVLICRGPVPENAAVWRARINAREASFADFLAAEHVELELSAPRAWSRWITPSVEPRRFDARFFLAVLPAGQLTSVDDHETTEEAWLTPEEALARQAAGQLKLPPPQMRTLVEMREAGRDLPSLLAAAEARRPDLLPILPRFAEVAPGQMALLLPWDPAYADQGTGDRHDWPSGQPLGAGPSRFLLSGSSWSLEYAT